MEKILIFDTTLRDGEQALQKSLSVREKLLIAQQLARLNVDIIEAGFPVSSPGDFLSVETIAQEVKGPVICGLARAVPKDIKACVDSLKKAERSRIHIFLATSNIHIDKKLKKDRDTIIEMAVNAVKYGRQFSDDIEFSCEDTGRTSPDLLYSIVEKVIDAGATTVNLPDTVGYTIPSEFGHIIKNVFNNVPNIDKATISVHCHNDLGLAAANSLTAIQMGARQVECTVNGLGERAGNASLEEIVMALKVRNKIFDLTTNINTQEIAPTSRLVSSLCNVSIPYNKAIVGKNAFAHSSGVHQDGVLKDKSTYEIMTPETIGIKENNLNLTSRSGRHVLKYRLNALGYADNSYDIEKIYQRFINLADKKGQVYDDDIELLMAEGAKENNDRFKLVYLNASSGSGIVPTATLKIKDSNNNKVIQEAATGSGPVDACYSAINRVAGISAKLTEYNISANPGGKMAIGAVNIITEHQGKKIHGTGFSTDIVEASALAYLNAINKIDRMMKVNKIKPILNQQP